MTSDSSPPLPDDSNPYVAPLAVGALSTPTLGPSETGLLLRWEKLRVVYNVILAAVVLAIWAGGRGSGLGDLAFLRHLARCCLGANLCFCIGPVVNFYAHWLGLRHGAVTVVLFVAGTGLSVLVAAGSILVFRMRGFD
ncbi:MAG: hypothetical protein WKF75_20805 [Singulisphaera sp.]